MSSPPGRSARSTTVTRWPRRLSRSAAASPAGPLPTTATRLSVRRAGTRGAIQPLRKPSSMRIELVVAVGGGVIPEHAGLFAQLRADPAGELGKRRGDEQPLQRLPRPALIQQVVPLGNAVVQRAAVVRLAEGHAAVHAARGLLAPRLRGKRRVQIRKVLQPLRLRAEGLLHAGVFQKTRRLAHALTFLPSRACILWG